MFSVIVIIFEVIAVLFIGIFARTNSSDSFSISNSSLIGDCFALLLAFTFMYTPFRKLSISSLALLLVIVGVTVQTNLLFDTFWQSCFEGFYSSFSVTLVLLARCLFASLAVLITVLDFIGLFGYWQVYFLIAPIMGIGYSLIEAIIVYGLKTFDGGGGMTIFLYSGTCSLMIWILCIRGKIDPVRYRIKQSYINQTLSFIGVMIAFVNWPKFNMAGAAATSIYNSYINTNNISVVYLQNSALANTFLGLSAAILTSILFSSKDSKEDKMKFKVYIDCFINGGIVFASYQDVALNPVSCIVMACFSTVITLVVHKYFIAQSQTESQSKFKMMMRNYSKIVFRMGFAVIGSIVAAIVVAARNGISPDLLSSDYYSRTAGLEVLAFIVALGLGVVFGLIVGVLINVFLASKATAQDKELNTIFQAQVNDFTFFDQFREQIHPLYYDIFEQINAKEAQKINIADYTTMVIRQSLLGAQDNPLRMMSVTKPVETRIDPQQAQKPKNDFSKRNDLGKNVSAMKVTPKGGDSEGSEKQVEQVIKPNNSLAAQKSRLKVTQDEKIPTQNKQNLARKLFEQDDIGSEIKNQKQPVRR